MSEAPPASVGQAVTRGAGWMISATVIGRSIDALNIMILARFLMPKDFGLVALATTLFTILTIITELQISNALLIIKNSEKDHYDTAFTLSVLRALLVVVGLTLGGFVLSTIYHDSRLQWICLALCLSPLAGAFQSPRYVLMSRKLQFSRIAGIEMSSKVAGFIATVTTAFLTHSYWAIVVGPIVGSVTLSAIVGAMLPFRPRFTIVRWRELLSFSVWTNLISITTTLSGRLDNFFVAGILSRTILGYYTLGDTLANILYSAILNPLQRVLFPGFWQLVHAPERLSAAFARSQQMLAMLVLPTGVGLALVADPLIALMLGPKWHVAATVVQFVSPIFALQSMIAPINAVLLAMGKQKILFFRSLTVLFVRLPLILAGLYFWGLYGFLCMRVFSGGFVVVLLNSTLVARFLGISIAAQFRMISRSVVSVIAMAAACIALRGAMGTGHSPQILVLQLGSIVTLGVCVFFASHFGLWLASGRPKGPETEVHTLLSALRSRLRTQPR
ncbi:lipopolysaccharide biosynthesis protein [Novosphingobium album (ex Liu et al. 2023)]|uniref:Lipopolysaccharide biosynthesis protein n=1 Tax=Novosphingobium album (ex Liu et al. 2023) TaxID=3031130 RepID=A0ABT5WK86_9SPHN|nr:lipopolysaccharide biosynthesis protein [Novosphingobium album (ex Liu et al. 2023)]MDE8650466.1 lipopolysaccharide biosynthesis protein [Novosphingobium album (ex Liu et al. 2023)]